MNHQMNLTEDELEIIASALNLYWHDSQDFEDEENNAADVLATEIYAHLAAKDKQRPVSVDADSESIEVMMKVQGSVSPLFATPRDVLVSHAIAFLPNAECWIKRVRVGTLAELDEDDVQRPLRDMAAMQREMIELNPKLGWVPDRSGEVVDAEWEDD